MKDNLPYSLRVLGALQMGDIQGVTCTIQTAIDEIGSKISGIASELPESDLPFLLATMQLMERAISSVVGENGQYIAKSIVDNSKTVVINLNELKKQYGDSQN